VPGGTFYRTYDVGTDSAYPDTSSPATLSTFRLDTFEVTVGRFRQFVTAGMGTQTNPPPTGTGARSLNGMVSQGGWDPAWNGSLAADTAAFIAALSCNATYQSWTDAPGPNEALPMNCISWFEAMAFCAWDGGFLPTEAEWNYASTGGSEQRAFPWSSPPSSLTIDCSYANHRDLVTDFCVNPPIGSVSRVGNYSPKGDGKWGHADIGGNLYEWTLDWYRTPYTNPCTDCADLTPATDRVIRGGNFNSTWRYSRGAYRNIYAPTGRDYGLGMRCARTPS